MKTEDVESLLWQVLDDMGRGGLCVCQATKVDLVQFYRRHFTGNGENLPSALRPEEAVARWGLDRDPVVDFLRHAARLLGHEHQCALGLRQWQGLYLDVQEALSFVPEIKDPRLDLAVASLNKLRERLE